MSRPKAYEAVDGYRYQILCRCLSKEWEHCDYATDNSDRKHLLENYRLAYGNKYEFKTIQLPRKFWKK